MHGGGDMAHVTYADVDRELEHSLLHRALFRVDRWLQKRQSVIEFTDHPECIFRIQIAQVPTQVTLANSFHAAPGDRFLKLHIWNEHIPPVPQQGATLSWARKMDRCVGTSLRELARWLTARRDLGDIAFVYGNAVFATSKQTRQLARISHRYGFEIASESSALPARFLHQLGENLLITFMVLALNPVALRSDSLWRTRVPLLMPRQVLLTRYRPR